MMTFARKALFVCTVTLWAVPIPHASSTPHTARIAQLGRFYEASSGTVFISIPTPYGIERFRFVSSVPTGLDSGEHHYRALSRLSADSPKNQDAAFSRFGDRGFMFFRSRRTGRAQSVSFSLRRRNERDTLANITVSRARSSSPHRCSNELGTAIPPSDTPLHQRAVAASQSSEGVATPSDRQVPPRVIQLAVYADSEFRKKHGATWEGYIRATINAVNVMYLPALGVRIDIVRLVKSSSKGTASSDPEEALERFRTETVERTSSVDLHHLFTGRNFPDLTTGIAYVATLCVDRGRYAVSLSRRVPEAIHPLVVAHEIAHSLSAVHDRSPGSIMNAEVSAHNHLFSEKMTRDIQEYLTQVATCVAVDTKPKVNLQIASSAEIFRADLHVTHYQSENCTVALQARQPRRKKRNHRGTGATRWRTITQSPLTTSDTSSATVTSFVTRMPLGARKPAKPYPFRAILVCGDTQGRSPIVSVFPPVIELATSQTKEPPNWLSQLAENFNS